MVIHILARETKGENFTFLKSASRNCSLWESFIWCYSWVLPAQLSQQYVSQKRLCLLHMSANLRKSERRMLRWKFSNNEASDVCYEKVFLQLTQSKRSPLHHSDVPKTIHLTCYRFMSKIKSVLSYAGPQHSGSPELLKYFVRKCCKWKHIGEDQHNLITSLTFRISKTTSLTVLKWYHLKLVMEKDLVRVKNVFSSIIVI